MAHEDFDSLIEQLGADYDTASEVLEEVVLGYLHGDSQLDAADSAIDEVAADLNGRSTQWADEAVPAAFLNGADEAIRDLKFSVSADDMARQGDFAVMSSLLRDGLLEDLAGATEQVSRDAKKKLREITRRNLETLTAGSGADLDAVVLDMEQELAQRGIVFTDRAGRKWDPGAYSRMLLRTYLAESENTGSLITAAQLGARYVRVSDGHGMDTDEPCTQANGQVWTILYALAHKIEHPNCRRAFSPLPASYAGPVDRGQAPLEEPRAKPEDKERTT